MADRLWLAYLKTNSAAFDDYLVALDEQAARATREKEQHDDQKPFWTACGKLAIVKEQRAVATSAEREEAAHAGYRLAAAGK